jgi:hypothetical protein
MRPDVSALVDAALAQHDDPATRQFEAVLAAASATGLDYSLERALRYWHRQSLANTRHYASTVVPEVLAIVDAAQAQSEDMTDRARAVAANFAHDLPEYPEVVVLPEADQPVRPRGVDQLEYRRRNVAARLHTL